MKAVISDLTTLTARLDIRCTISLTASRVKRNLPLLFYKAVLSSISQELTVFKTGIALKIPPGVAGKSPSFSAPGMLDGTLSPVSTAAWRPVEFEPAGKHRWNRPPIYEAYSGTSTISHTAVAWQSQKRIDRYDAILVLEDGWDRSI